MKEVATMSVIRMASIDLNKLRAAHEILSQVVDALIDDSDELAIELEPLQKPVKSNMVELYNQDYSGEDCCEGMRW